MSFSQMAQILREQNKEKIVLIKIGVFFIAIYVRCRNKHTKNIFKNNA